MNAAARFFAKVTPDPTGSGCLLWTGALDTNGYGRFQDVVGRNMPAHRWLLERVHGRNEDLVVDHLCRVRACVRPSHLEFVTSAENVRRGEGPARIRAKAAARTHCAHKHELTPENTYWYRGKRRCKTCMAASNKTPSMKAWRAANARDRRARERIVLTVTAYEGNPPEVVIVDRRAA